MAADATHFAVHQGLDFSQYPKTAAAAHCFGRWTLVTAVGSQNVRIICGRAPATSKSEHPRCCLIRPHSKGKDIPLTYAHCVIRASALAYTRASPKQQGWLAHCLHIDNPCQSYAVGRSRNIMVFRVGGRSIEWLTCQVPHLRTLQRLGPLQGRSIQGHGREG
jgi:hypothetical protein